MIEDNTQLAINLVKKLIEYPALNNLKVELFADTTIISRNNIFIAHYEDLLEDVKNYSLYYKPIEDFNLVLTDEDNGMFPYRSTISFFTENDELRTKFTFYSDYFDITSYEKTTTTMERMLRIKSHYKSLNMKKIDLYSEINYN